MYAWLISTIRGPDGQPITPEQLSEIDQLLIDPIEGVTRVDDERLDDEEGASFMGLISKVGG